MSTKLRMLEDSVKIKPINAIAILVLPLVGLVLLIYIHSLHFGHMDAGLAIFFLMYIVSMVGLELGFHRYFTHRAFVSTPRFKTVLAVMGSMAANGPVLWWVAIHRAHHSHSDKEADPHSPNNYRKGFLSNLYHAHIGWLFDPHLTQYQGEWLRNLKQGDLTPPLIRIHLHYKRYVLLGLMLPALLVGLSLWSWEGVLIGFLWGGPVRIFFVSHSYWSINSVCHRFGSRPFCTINDHSRNNVIVALLTLGQGWHNNHHAYPMAGIIGHRWWEFDIGGVILRLWERLGWVSDIKRIPRV